MQRPLHTKLGFVSCPNSLRFSSFNLQQSFLLWISIDDGTDDGTGCYLGRFPAVRSGLTRPGSVWTGSARSSHALPARAGGPPARPARAGPGKSVPLDMLMLSIWRGHDRAA